jgi:hypothetical protein
MLLRGQYRERGQPVLLERGQIKRKIIEHGRKRNFKSAV